MGQFLYEYHLAWLSFLRSKINHDQENVRSRIPETTKQNLHFKSGDRSDKSKCVPLAGETKNSFYRTSKYIVFRVFIFFVVSMHGTNEREKSHARLIEMDGTI